MELPFPEPESVLQSAKGEGPAMEKEYFALFLAKPGVDRQWNATEQSQEVTHEDLEMTIEPIYNK